MVVSMVLVVVLAVGGLGMFLWSRGRGRQVSLVNGFRTSPRAVELLHASVAAVPANAFDARLRIVRR